MSNKNFVTEKGIAVYPWLTKEDPKFGGYKTGLRLNEKDHKAFAEFIKDTFVEEFGAKAFEKASSPIKKDKDGNEYFAFKTKNAPKLYDSHGKPILKAPEGFYIGGGSTIKLSGALSVSKRDSKYFCTLYLNKVQIIDLVQSSGSAFQEEEGSFDASEFNNEGDTFGSSEDAPSVANEEVEF